jgi:CubicO group peptidase (beta-lactamase class C family)
LTGAAATAMALALATAAAAAPPPPFEWRAATPESQGLSTDRLDALKDELAPRATAALLIVRNDRIIYEWYAPGTTASTRLGSASTAKALIGGMAAAAEVDDGLIRLDDRAARYIPQWRGDPARSRITLRELGAHTSGLDDAEEGGIAHGQLTGWKGDFWKRPAPPRDPFTLSRDVVPVIFPPGTGYAYSNPGIAMLAYALTVPLQGSAHPDLHSYLRDRVMRPIGIADQDWSAGYDGIIRVDGLPLVGAWGGATFTARALARIGRLMIHDGDWEGRRILGAKTVHAVADHVHGTPGNVSIGWWSNREGYIPMLPRDAYYAAGAGHRVVVVIPSRHTIVIRNGEALSRTEPSHEAQLKYLFQPMMEALGPGP